MHLRLVRFTQSTSHPDKTEPARITEASYPYAKVVKESKWQTESLREADVSSRARNISIADTHEANDDGLLRRCILGTLAAVRRWTTKYWKTVF